MSDPFFWMVFFSAALALNLSPGPDLLYVFSRTLSGGRRIGIISACGVCSGALVHVVFAALGISAILATSALAFTVVKYIGAAYLLYLGFQALRSAGVSLIITIFFDVPIKAVFYANGQEQIKQKLVTRPH